MLYLLPGTRWKQVSQQLRKPLPSLSGPVGPGIDFLKHPRRRPHREPAPKGPDPGPLKTSPSCPGQSRPLLRKNPDLAGDRLIQTRGRIMRMLHDEPPKGSSGEQLTMSPIQWTSSEWRLTHRWNGGLKPYRKPGLARSYNNPGR